MSYPIFAFCSTTPAHKRKRVEPATSKINGDTSTDAKTKAMQAFALTLRAYDKRPHYPQTVSGLQHILNVGTLWHSSGLLDTRLLGEGEYMHPMNWWLHHAARFCDDESFLPTLTKLFELFMAISHGEYDGAGDPGWPLLMDSILCRTSFIFDLLMSQPSIDLNLTNDDMGWNALFLAVSKNKAEYVRRLLDRYYELDLDLVDNDGLTVTHYAKDPTITSMLNHTLQQQMPLYKTAARNSITVQIPPVLTNVAMQFLFKTP